MTPADAPENHDAIVACLLARIAELEAQADKARRDVAGEPRMSKGECLANRYATYIVQPSARVAGALFVVVHDEDGECWVDLPRAAVLAALSLRDDL